MRTHRAKGRIKKHLKKRSESISDLKRDNKRERQYTDKYIKRLHEMQKKRDKAVDLLKEIREIVRNSDGTALNEFKGTIVPWEVHDVIADLDASIKDLKS